MNRNVNAIAGRLSLRAPQRQSLEALHRITEIAPPGKSGDIETLLAAIHSEFPTVTNFDRDFISLCFALATGVGKTRLMGAFIAYLHLEHGINNFFVMAPNLTIYKKLIDDFTPNTPKYVFKGISEFATDPPDIITGDDYETKAGSLSNQLMRCKINIFNISKINTEVRGGKSPRIKRLSEYIGESYFEYLAALSDLVLIMDESHRYRASAGVRAINELEPVMGLELTATPYVGRTVQTRQFFNNVLIDYPLGKAMADGFVKEPAVVTRQDFDPRGMSQEAIEQLKLEDGVRMHEQTKVVLETYARETGAAIVKPIVLVVCQDTAHADEVERQIESEVFFEGRYKTKVITVHSNQSGDIEDKSIARLLNVESPTEPTEIVIHVNKLGEGWDVTNIFTIVPLRAAAAPRLIEQTMGRGLRLPYGRRTGMAAVDRLSIIAHDKFQEIIDEASRPEAAIKIQQIILNSDDLQTKTITVMAASNLTAKLGLHPEEPATSTQDSGKNTPPTFTDAQNQRVAQITYGVIQRLGNEPNQAPTMAALDTPELQAFILQEVEATYMGKQLDLEGITEKPDFTEIVSQTTKLVVQEMIPIPRIQILPKGEVRSWFDPFTLELSSIRYPTPSKDLWVHNLHTGEGEAVGVSNTEHREARMEDYVVAGLVDFDDVAYDSNADLLYDLANQTVTHFRSYLKEAEIWQVLHFHQKDIAEFIHAQMHKHYNEEAVGYEASISKGFTELKMSAYTANASEPPLDYRVSPENKSNMAKYLFGGFSKCLYPVQKFHSEAERRLAVVLERESMKWFKPAKGQFQIYYNQGADHPEYQPDFVAETDETIYMLEPKAKSEMENLIVLAKRDAARAWCKNASDYACKHGGKPWIYILIPHDVIAENMTLNGLTAQFASEPKTQENTSDSAPGGLN